MSLSLLRKGESTAEKQPPLPPLPGQKKKKKRKKSGAIFLENIFPFIVLCSLLWNDPG